MIASLLSSELRKVSSSWKIFAAIHANQELTSQYHQLFEMLALTSTQDNALHMSKITTAKHQWLMDRNWVLYAANLAKLRNRCRRIAMTNIKTATTLQDTWVAIKRSTKILQLIRSVARHANTWNKMTTADIMVKKKKSSNRQ